MYLTFAGIQRISSSSTNRIVALVRNRRIGDPDSHETAGNRWRGEGSVRAHRRRSLAPGVWSRWVRGGPVGVRRRYGRARLRPQPSNGDRCYPRLDDRPHARCGARLSGPRRDRLPTNQPAPPSTLTPVIRLDSARDLERTAARTRGRPRSRRGRSNAHGGMATGTTPMTRRSSSAAMPPTMATRSRSCRSCIVMRSDRATR